MVGTFTNIQVRFVFSAKHRAGLITPERRPRLDEYLGGIFRQTGAVLYEIGGTVLKKREIEHDETHIWD